MVASLIPKELYTRQRKKSKISIEWVRQNILPVVSVVTFLAAGFVYGALFLYDSTLSSRVAEFRVQYTETLGEVDAEGRILASNFALRAEELTRLIAEHNSPSALFELLEDTTHPDVTFSSFAFAFKSGEIRVDGAVGGYNKLAEQILIWEQDPAITGVEVSDFTVDTSGNLKFQATLFLNKDLYAQP